jgi:hypothetical protein
MIYVMANYWSITVRNVFRDGYRRLNRYSFLRKI